jgi:hypothetical protein
MSKPIEHTPGPWEVDRTVALGAYGVWADSDGHHEQICSVLTVSFKTGDDKRKRVERDANARLIAASPDLLAALKELVEIDELRRKLGMQDYAKTSRTSKAWLAARAAIQKAEANQ